MLYKGGLHAVAILYVLQSGSLPVQFKALAILRLLVQGTCQRLDTDLVNNNVFARAKVKIIFPPSIPIFQYYKNTGLNI